MEHKTNKSLYMVIFFPVFAFSQPAPYLALCAISTCFVFLIATNSEFAIVNCGYYNNKQEWVIDCRS